MNLENEINNELNLENKNEQNNFFNSTIGKAIDNGIDIGLRYLLPDFIEEQVIDFKDNLIEYGLKDGISKTIDSAVETGKSVVGMVTGDFENISQIKNVIKNGGIIDSVSDLLDDVIDKMNDKGKVNDTISDLIKNGKDAILENVEKNIEDTLNKQSEELDDLENNIKQWKEYYEKQDFNSMENVFEKIEKEINELIPIENTIKEVRTIENLHNLIKNNNEQFNLTKEEIELAEKLNI